MSKIQEINALMKKHDIFELYMGGAASSSVSESKDEYIIQFGDLPQLTFFVELAALCGVPLESIKTESEESYGGCDTCGYGAGNEITVRVPRLS